MRNCKVIAVTNQIRKNHLICRLLVKMIYYEGRVGMETINPCHWSEQRPKTCSIAEKTEYIKIDRDKSTFKSHRDFDSEIEMTFKHF